MKLQTGYENRRARVEMLPLVDVVFLLLVFFIYAMLSMVVHHGIEVDLPTAGEAKVDTREYIGITLTAENRIFLEKEETTLDELVAAVLSRFEDSSDDTPLYIEGDRAADLGLAIEILDRLRAAGITQVSFSSRIEPES